MIEGILMSGLGPGAAIQDVTGIPLGSLAPPALLGLVVIYFLMGKIVPRSALDDKQLETDRWRAAYEAERDSRKMAEAQTVELLELAKTTNAILVTTFGPGGPLSTTGHRESGR